MPRTSSEQSSNSSGTDSKSGYDPSDLKSKFLTSRKFLLCIATLVGSFVLVLMDKDVRGLEVIWPAVLAVYFGANVGANYVNKRAEYSPSRDLSDLRRKK